MNSSLDEARKSREKWDRRFLELAKHVATFSKDPSTRVGAVLVNDKREIVGTGYNGFPRGVKDDPERYNDRKLKYKLVVHAELNAILTAGDKAKGATIYVYPGFGRPNLCTECCKSVIQSGVLRVVGLEPHIDSSNEVCEEARRAGEERRLRWKESLELSAMMLAEAGIEVDSYRE